MRTSIAVCFSLVFAGVVCCAANDAKTTQPDDVVPSHLINVQFSGPLSSSFVERDGPAPGVPIDEVVARELESATVTVGGTVIGLDWSRSSTIRDELLWWSIPRSGDFRSPHAEVTGQLVFKPFRELDQTVQVVPAGVSAETPVPVVIVESIKVQLAGPDGKPRGPQPDRELIVAKAKTTEQVGSEQE